MPHTYPMENIGDIINTKVSGFGIRLDVNDLNRWIRALVKVEFKAKTLVEDTMQKNCASDLQQNIYTAIKTGKIAESPEYHPRYKEWKNRFFSGKPVWELKGDLASNLRAFSIPKSGSGRDWVAGVPNGVMDSGGKSLNANGSGRTKAGR